MRPEDTEMLAPGEGYLEPAMTMRAYIATAALQGILTTEVGHWLDKMSVDERARYAVYQADALLKELDK